MLFIGGAAWWSAARSAETFRWVDHTHAVLYRLEVTLTKLLVLQSSSRGYALTAREDLLQTYEADEAVARENWRSLRQVIADNPAQLQRFDRLDPLVARAIDLFRERIALRRNVGLEAVTNPPPNTTGWATMDLVLKGFNEMETAERRLLAARSAAAQAGQRQAVMVFGLGSLVATLLVVAAGFIVRRDFLRRQEAEDALRQNEMRTRLMIDSVRDYALLMLDPGGRITSWNSGAQRIKGYPAGEIIGRHFSCFYPEDAVRSGFPETELRLAAAQGRFEDEGWRMRRDGTRFWANVVISAMRNPAGELLGFVKVTRDLTERRQAEEERDRFFSLSLDLLCISSPDGYFKRVSPAVTDILGWTVAEFLAQPYIDLVHPDDRPATLREVERQIATGEKVLQFENRYRHKDGSWRLLSWRSVPYDGLMYAIARDVTEQKLVEAQIRQLNTNLKQRAALLESANKELEAFSYSVSHDLRAPLRHVDGFANLLQKLSAAKLDDQGRHYLTTISDSARQMGRLIDDLLSFSRMGRMALQLREVADHDALLAAIIRDGRWDRAGRPIEWHIAPLPRVHADQAMLQQVWANLLDNAVKYSGKVPAPRIEVGARSDPATGEQVFFVRDNGAGFDMRYVDKLFGVFQRLHGPAEFEGTGIGLANVRRIILRHGGRTWAEGAPGQGATFYFSLPATSTSAAA
ncbi:PAS domain S-box protein [Opitutus sp. GAS368]|uniref:PAS domain S-box protein n=1 Tax=Opitutus sp. GAS368 TaxID=1882749 RepID=UPI00087A051B|nr:PAS domain S-box protein [Opitutus sp. GAS368]SDR93587.1 PAS/PAC sensor signal transduction histidine kinase [Opitutus sp. GAS368]